jgi:predicted Fe-Mo cluster-binding NifX family protein
MKIAISSTGKNLESEVDSRFGRCPYFLLVEIDKKNKEIKDFEAIENTARKEVGGAGITAGELVGNLKPNAVITTNMGPRAFQIFEQLKIKVYQGEGKIKEILNRFLKGNLKEIGSANGPQHKGLK